MSSVTHVKTGKTIRGFSRILHLHRTRGWRRTLYAAVRWMARLPVLRRLIRICASDLWRLALAEHEVAPQIPCSFIVRMATSEDLPSLADYYGGMPLVRERMERGDRCYITLCHDRIGAAVWVEVGPGEYRDDWAEMRFVCRFPTHVGWTYDGKGTRWGAWGMLMIRFPEFMRSQGIQELVTLIDCNNWQSIDAHRSLGYERIGTLGCFGLLGVVGNIFRSTDRKWHRLPARSGRIELLGRCVVDD